MTHRTIIAFDFGTGSIGIAIGQAITATASPLTALKAKNGQPNWLQIKHILQEWQPKIAIVGLPMNMDYTEPQISNKARKFAKCINSRFGIPVTLHDERLTTREAKAQLFHKGGYRALHKSNIDSISAVIILESWLEQHADTKSNLFNF